MNSEDAKLLATSFLDHYRPNRQKSGCAREVLGYKPIIVVLNREGARRSLGNHEEIIEALRDAGYDVTYKESFDGVPFVEQMRFLSQVDILIGPHGAQFTNTLFQPECGSLLELFNREYYCPNFFGSLAALSGKHHFFVYPGGETNQKTLHAAREAPFFEVNPDIVVEMTNLMVKRWHSCCQSGFRAEQQ